jgi:hypothetical protein
MKLWDVDIHCDNHVHFRNRSVKTGGPVKGRCFKPSEPAGYRVERSA